MNAISFILTALFSFTFLLAHGQKTIIDFERLHHGLDSIIEFYHEEGLFSGYIHIQQGDSVLYSAGNGWMDTPGGIPLSDTSLFPIGSITKTFTGAAILLLEQQGKLRLSDPVSLWIPAFSQYPSVTISHLLYHTSCIPVNLWGLRELTTADENRLLADHVYELIDSTKNPLRCIPGHRAVYSNIGYMVLGDLIERVSGMTFADYIRLHLLEPLGMTRTMVADRVYIDKPGFTNTFIRKPKRGKYRDHTWLNIAPEFFLPLDLPAAGFMYSTPTELVNLRKYWTTNAILPDSLRKKTQQPNRLKDGTIPTLEAYPGYMISDLPLPLGRIYQMTGGLPGLQCAILHSPDTDLTFIYINNEIIYKNKYWPVEDCKKPMDATVLYLNACIGVK